MKSVFKLLSILLIFTVVNVKASSYGMYLNSSNTTVLSGEEVSVNISLGNISDIPSGLDACQASISSSGVSITSISGTNGWNVTNGSVLILDTSNAVKSSASIAVIKAKVNSEGYITISNIVCSDGENEYNASGSKINFKIKEPDKVITNQEVNTNTTNTSGTNNSAKTPSTTNSNTNKKVVVNNKTSYLKSLTIDGIVFEFNKNTFEYNLEVDNSIDKISIKYETEDSNAKVEKSGKDELSVGMNTIELSITNGSSFSKYIININRKDVLNEVTNNEEEILNALKQDIDILKVKVDINDTNKTISTNILKYLKENNKNIIYEVYENNNIVYSFKVLGKNIDKTNEFSFNIIFNSNYNNTLNKLLKGYTYKIVNFEYRGELPKNTEIILYNTDFKNKVYLYYYNSLKDKIMYIKDIKNSDNIKLLLDSTNEYILTDYYVTKEEKSNTNIIVIIIILVVIILSGIVFFLRKKLHKRTVKKTT